MDHLAYYSVGSHLYNMWKSHVLWKLAQGSLILKRLERCDFPFSSLTLSRFLSSNLLWVLGEKHLKYDFVLFTVRTLCQILPGMIFREDGYLTLSQPSVPCQKLLSNISPATWRINRSQMLPLHRVSQYPSGPHATSTRKRLSTLPEVLSSHLNTTLPPTSLRKLEHKGAASRRYLSIVFFSVVVRNFRRW